SSTWVSFCYCYFGRVRLHRVCHRGQAKSWTRTIRNPWSVGSEWQRKKSKISATGFSAGGHSRRRSSKNSSKNLKPGAIWTRKRKRRFVRISTAGGSSRRSNRSVCGSAGSSGARSLRSGARPSSAVSSSFASYRRRSGASCVRNSRRNSKASRQRKSRSCDRNFASVWKDYRRNKSNKCEKNFVNGQSGSKTKERLSASNSETRQARTRKIANERPRSKLRYQKNI